MERRKKGKRKKKEVWLVGVNFLLLSHGFPFPPLNIEQ